MIAAVAAVKNEADIIEANIRHLLSQGVDLIRISDGMSTDGTQDILNTLRSELGGQLEIIYDRNPIFHQAQIMNQLMYDVGPRGATWVIPFDADEFFYVEGGRTLAGGLHDAHLANKLWVPSILHLDWDRRVVNLHRWPKVIVRWSYGIKLTMGNHDVWGPPESRLDQVHPGPIGFSLRELQFRSFEHYCSKVALNLQTLDRSLPADHAAHYRALEGMDRDALEAQWQLYQSQPTVHDPVPSSSRHLIGTS